MPIKPIERVSISEQVFEQIKDELLNGTWKAGERLPSEKQLAKLFSVSRVTIRHALQKLTVLGFIETKLGEGSFAKEISLAIYMNSTVPIADLTPKMMQDVLEFRQIVEVRTVGLCATKATQKDIENLKAIYNRMRACKDDYHSFSIADLDFHMEIANITGNILIIETHKIIRNILEAAMAGIVKKRGSSRGIYFHGELLSAISSGIAEDAMNIMEEHLRDTYESIVNGTPDYEKIKFTAIQKAENDKN